MALEPEDMPSVIQFKKITDKFEITPYTSMVVCDNLEEARTITEKLENEYLVADINSLSYYIPSPQEQDARLVEIAKIRNMGTRYHDLIYSPIGYGEVGSGDPEARMEHHRNRRSYRCRTRGRQQNSEETEPDDPGKIFGAERGKPGDEIFQKLISVIESDPENTAMLLTELDLSFTREMDRGHNRNDGH